MSDKEMDKLLKTMRENGRKLVADKVKNTQFLKKIGILNRNGNVSKAYKDICIPIEQG